MPQKTGKKRDDVGRGRPPKEYQFKSGNRVATGRPKGVRSRSTIAKKVIGMIGMLPQDIYSKLIKMYPEMEKRISIEEVMSIVQAHRAITKGDTYAYNSLMDSAYGRAAQAITGPEGTPLFGKNVSKGQAKRISEAISIAADSFEEDDDGSSEP